MDKVSKEEMQRIREKNRHDDLMVVMKNLTSSLENPKSFAKITSALDEFSRKISELSTGIQSPPSTPGRDFSPDYSQVVSSLEVISRSIAKSAAELKQNAESGRKDWEFKVNRDSFGNIYSVTASQR